VAFRTAETASDLNGDFDTDDDVMRVWDLVSGQLLETAQAVTPCRFEACRPRRPYRVSGSLVTFLTLEDAQGGLDLDGNGDANGIVIQTFNARKAAQAAGGGGGFAFAAASSFFSSADPEVTTLAGVSAGVCTATGEACSTDADCGGGPRSCFLPPGSCIENLTTACNVSTGCTVGFCRPSNALTGDGTCHQDNGPCATTSECPADNVCEDATADLTRLVGAINAEPDGAQLLPALETGEGTCANDAQCAPDEHCLVPPLSLTGTCQPDDPVVVTAGAPDTDGDGVDDVHDNCARRTNPDQADLDGDGAGDACDLETCGDGVQTYAEECDGGNAVPGDGCDAACRLEAGATAACQNGIDDDGDGRTDYPADTGCAHAGDPSERRAARACDNGRDDDGDGRIDVIAVSLGGVLGDVACADEAGPSESPQCQNGLDDDLDGDGIDFDGGAALGLSGPPDPQCTSSSVNLEDADPPPPPPPWTCGLGPELAALLPLLEALRRRGHPPTGRA
jgi:cysteine-rich repeat protein